MKLPNVEDARVDRTKIVDYLLALEHQEGAAKAAFFLRFGFTAADWQTFAGALISHARTGGWDLVPKPYGMNWINSGT